MTGIGQFRAAMALYQDGSFLEPFGMNPTLQQDQTMYVGVFLLDTLLPQVIDHVATLSNFLEAKDPKLKFWLGLLRNGKNF